MNKTDTHGFYIRWLLISRCARMMFFLRKKIGFDDSFDVTKCLQQIEMPDLLHVCASRNDIQMAVGE